jgi:hypothetical protein
MRTSQSADPRGTVHSVPPAVSRILEQPRRIRRGVFMRQCDQFSSSDYSSLMMVTEEETNAMTNKPTKTRAAREVELQRLWTAPGGRSEVIELFRKAMGSPAGTIPNSAKHVFKAILDKEYPVG